MVSELWIDRVATTEPLVYLTFDGGGSDNGTARILDTLRDYSVRATMFLTAPYIRRFPARVDRMLQDGHDIANHTDTHPVLIQGENLLDDWLAYAGRPLETRNDLTRDDLVHELAVPAQALREMTGTDMVPLWRSPYGYFSNQINRWAYEAGFGKNILWTHYFRDMEEKDPNLILKNTQTFLDNGDARGAILLGHLGSVSADNPHMLGHALPDILGALDRRGLGFSKLKW